MILNEYTLKKKLGKGAYGEVHLVDNRNGDQFALKSIGLQGLKSQPYLLDYLEGQIECMKTMNSKYIMKLYATHEDQNNKYLVCQYCEGGDLFNYQAKFPGKVFSLDDATRVLADVIKGLQDLHGAGYLHRDIKSQNILIKNQNGKQYFKLADFGFSKKSSQVEGTVLGTEYYMSPQIYRSQRYGFEIDMWAFGVLFYFMLNLEFPFKINPRSSPEKKEADLVKASTNFSYQRSVKDSTKKLTKNCTPETEDLFKKIFNPIIDERITFLQLRQHPLFAKHFPEVSYISKKIYNQKYDDSKILKRFAIQNPQKDDENVRQTKSIIKKKDKSFPQEKLLLENKKDQIDFLRQNQEQISYSNYFKAQEKLSLSFNLTKYYIILLKDFIQSLKNPQILLKINANLKWKQFSKTKVFKNILTQAQQDFNKAEVKFNLIYGQCSNYLNQINTINQKFKAAFQKQISQKQFKGSFKQSYRNSTHRSFNNLRDLMKNDKKGNKFNYYLAILVISHVFNRIFTDSENMKVIFNDYFKQSKRSLNAIDYSELRQWMTKATVGQLNAVTLNITSIYFS